MFTIIERLIVNVFVVYSCANAAQSYSMTAATSVYQPASDSAAAASDGVTELQSPSAIYRLSSKRISATEGSHLVLARYSQKSSASHDEELAGALLHSDSVGLTDSYLYILPVGYIIGFHFFQFPPLLLISVVNLSIISRFLLLWKCKRTIVCESCNAFGAISA